MLKFCKTNTVQNKNMQGENSLQKYLWSWNKMKQFSMVTLRQLANATSMRRTSVRCVFKKYKLQPNNIPDTVVCFLDTYKSFLNSWIQRIFKRYIPKTPKSWKYRLAFLKCIMNPCQACKQQLNIFIFSINSRQWLNNHLF